MRTIDGMVGMYFLFPSCLLSVYRSSAPVQRKNQATNICGESRYWGFWIWWCLGYSPFGVHLVLGIESRSPTCEILIYVI